MAKVNDHLILIGGKSASGKSASLMNLRNPESVMYLNCESGKRLPFAAKFIQRTVTDPLQVLAAFDYAETKPEIKVIVVDSLTYLLDMYESIYIHGSADGRTAWGNFAQFFKELMQQKVANSTKKVLFLAHTLESYNESDMVMDVKVPVKGALKNQGVESYFSVVITAKKMTLKDLENYESSLLNITEEERMLGYKHVFQTRLTKETVTERMRGPMGMFSSKETFVDNDIQAILDRLDEYYKDTV